MIAGSSLVLWAPGGNQLRGQAAHTVPILSTTSITQQVPCSSGNNLGARGSMSTGAEEALTDARCQRRDL